MCLIKRLISERESKKQSKTQVYLNVDKAMNLIDDNQDPDQISSGNRSASF
jgi:hypothetical protein